MGEHVPYLIGTMIELPRAALTADEIARDGRVLLVRHERPHADDVRAEPRRRRPLPAALHREGDLRRRPVPGARRARRGQADHASRVERRPRASRPDAQGRHLRRARRRAALRDVLSPARAGLRVVLAVPRADRASGGGARRVGGRRRSISHQLSAISWNGGDLIPREVGAMPFSSRAARDWRLAVRRGDSGRLHEAGGLEEGARGHARHLSRNFRVAETRALWSDLASSPSRSLDSGEHR